MFQFQQPLSLFLKMHHSALLTILLSHIPRKEHPHGTGSLSVSREYLALPDGPGRFTQNSSCSALLRIPLCFYRLGIRNFHALWLNFPEHSSNLLSCNNVVLQPHICRNIYGLGSSPFARHY